MFGMFKKKEPFWAWLAENGGRIKRELPGSPERMAGEIAKAFKHDYPDLVWEIGPSDSGPWAFTVSADGKRELFPAVLDAVRAAPEIAGWNVQAFRPRGKPGVKIEMGDRSLGLDDIWCAVEHEGEGVHVLLLIRGLTPDTDQLLSGAAVILLDHAVGEYDACTKILSLDRRPLPDGAEASERLFPLSELPAVLDAIGSGAGRCPS